MTRSLRTVDKIAYGQLAFPLAFAGLPLYIFAPDFYAVEYGISLAFLGGALFVIRLFDAFCDPLIGRLSDRLHRHRGSLLAIAALAFAVCFAALYRPPPALEIFWFVCTIFFATLAFSVLVINLGALGALGAPDEAGKQSLAAWREGFGLAGLLCAMILPAFFGSMPLYAAFAALSALGCAACFLVWLRGRALPAPPPVPQEGFRALLQGPFRRFFAAYGVSMLGSSLPAVLFVFYVRDWLGAEDKTGLFLMIYFGAAIAAVPLWRLALRRLSAPQIWVSGMCLSALSLCGAVLIQSGDLALYAVVCLLTGIGFGAEIFMPPAILAQHIAAARREAQSASFFGLYAFFMKMALAAATALAFISLDLAGFRPAADAAAADGLGTLVTLYALLPAVIKLCAVFILLKTEKRHEISSHPLHTGSRHVS